MKLSLRNKRDDDTPDTYTGLCRKINPEMKIGNGLVQAVTLYLNGFSSHSYLHSSLFTDFIQPFYH